MSFSVWVVLLFLGFISWGFIGTGLVDGSLRALAGGEVLFWSSMGDLCLIHESSILMGGYVRMDLLIHVSLILALSRLLLEQSLSASFWVSIHSSIGVNWRNCTYEIVSLSQYCTIHQSLVKFKRKFTYFGTTLYKVRKLCLQILGCFQVAVIWFCFL